MRRFRTSPERCAGPNGRPDKDELLSFFLQLRSTIWVSLQKIYPNDYSKLTQRNHLPQRNSDKLVEISAGTDGAVCC